jgi:hypothetical protein
VVRRAAVTFCVLAFSLAACGGERTFSAQSLIDELNTEGAGLELREVIATNPDGFDVHEVELAAPAESPTGKVTEPTGHGALVVLEDAGAAEDELTRCEAAPAFTCFRAANAVLRFEDLFPEEQARISTAFQAIAPATQISVATRPRTGSRACRA